MMCFWKISTSLRKSSQFPSLPPATICDSEGISRVKFNTSKPMEDNIEEAAADERQRENLKLGELISN